MKDYLPHLSLLRLLAVLALVIAPHLLRLPGWESVAVITLLVWRALASSRQWKLPPQALKLALALLAFAGVYASYGRVTGQNAGIALLVLMLALKLTEMRSRRDVMVVVFLIYFLLVTHFLYSQELWTILYLLLSVVAITAVLIDAHHAATPLPLRVALRTGAVMTAQALPLMLLFFVLFPRIPGPLWGLPSDAGAARSGLSDSLSPGDISQLTLSREVAFRVRFDGAPPVKSALYWRGPVFRQFNGRSWTQAPDDVISRRFPRVELQAARVDYELTLEPMRSRWLFALDLPDPRALPPDSRLDPTGALVMDKPLTERRLLRLASVPRYRLDAGIPAQNLEYDLRLPAGSNPRTRALAQQWRAQGLQGEALAREALRRLREQPYWYSLRPPPLGRHSADEFLFDTQRGYCEHYASAFAILMRAGGVPARVVTGYHGMEANLIGDYHVVRQSDAHAWTEIWLGDRGWVRVDPTAAVPPERVEPDLLELRAGADGLPGLLGDYERFKYAFEARWDWVNARWNQWVLAYGPETQRELLARLGIGDLRGMILTLTVGLSVVLALIGLLALRGAQRPPVREPALRLWQGLLRRLRRHGYEQRPEEGPRDFVERVSRQEPHLADSLRAVLEPYLRLRYVGEADAAGERELAAAVRRVRRTR